MTRAECWFVHLSNVAVGGTGLVYGWMRYFAEPADEFAVVNHPWQPELQHAHILVAPLLVLAVGVVFGPHALAHLRRGTPRGRRSGWTLLLTAFPMIFSGYALQVSEGEAWTTTWMWLHLVTSGLWLGFAFVHPFLPAPRRAKA